MRYSAIVNVLISFALVAPAAVIVRNELQLDPDNPQASDPKQPPKTLSVPPGTENPFKTGFQTAPDTCTDFQRPSERCVKDLQAQSEGVVAFSGGELKWDNDNQCDDTKKAVFQTAAYDAHVLAAFANTLPDEHSARDIALWKTWMGPDYINQQQRVVDNLKRASDYLARKTFDIILSCKDTKNYCKVVIDGKSVGGYAWTYKGWFGYKYQYITMCQPFFQTDDLEYKITEIEADLARGDLKTSQEAERQKTTGQMFLHEMMHLDAVGQPHINDERVDQNEVGPWAYGPRLVYKLAIRALNQGGGATRASTNADSYAWYANSKYFWDLTGYFPAPPKFRDAANIDSIGSGEEARAQNGWPIHLGVIDQDTSEDEIQARYNAAVGSMQTAVPPPLPPTSPDSNIPAPTCANEGTTFGQPPVEDYIKQLCDNQEYWDKVITPPVSTGTGETNAGLGKAIGVSESHDIPGTSDKLHLALMYTNKACSGTFRFTRGANDDDKREHCRSRFRNVLNGCQTDTITDKKGGSLQDVCAVYVITTAKDGVDPFGDWYKDQGEFKCEETEVLGEKRCSCYYSGYPRITDLFKIPSSGNCNDVNQDDLVIN